MKRLVLILSGFLLFLCGCGGGKSATPIVAVALSPSAQTTMDQGQTLNLTATVTNDSGAKGVTWSVSGTTCTGTACGTLTNSTTSAVTYNAPASVSSNMTVTVVATSGADTTKSMSAAVVVSPAPSITTTSLSNGAVGTAYSATLAASGGAGTLTWSLATGSSLPAGLSLSGSGAISGTPTAAATTNFTVKVTDASGGQPGPVSQTQQLSITIAPGPLTITTTSLANGTVGTAYSEPLQAAGGKPPYIWTVTSGSSLPTWLSLGGSGTNWTISGTPAAAGTSTFSLTVTDSTTPTAQSKSQSLSVTVVGVSASCASGNEPILKGQYAFSLSGHNSSGYVAAIGSFTADGSGHITAGTVDSNGALGVKSGNITATGSAYSVGPDNRGCATIVTPFYTFTTRFALVTPPSTVASEGTIQEWDSGSTPFIGSGQILLQTLPAALQNGTYVYRETGVYGTSQERIGSIGTITANGAGSFTAGEYDSNAAGTHHNYSGLSGTYTTPNSTTGRYTTTTSLSGISAGHVGYLVSNNHYLQLSTAALSSLTAVLITDGQLQNGLTVSNKLVYYASGMESSGAGSVVQIGLVTITNSTTLTANVYEDDAGTWATPNPSTPSCTYAIDSSGRLTTSGASCGTNPPVFYLTGPNTAVMMGTGSEVLVGQLLPQLATSITAAPYFFGTQETVNLGVETETGVATLSSAGAVNGTNDSTSVSSPQQGDQPLTDTLTVNSDGTFSDSNHPGQVSGIVISDHQLVLVDSQGSTYPTMLVIQTTPAK